MLDAMLIERVTLPAANTDVVGLTLKAGKTPPVIIVWWKPTKFTNYPN